jgi:membrane-associated protease RseP (regulator of RpoE activity)
MRNRKVLLDVGAAGPLTGLVFALPILLIGLATSQVGPVSPGGVVEGNSVLYALSKILIFGQFFPSGGYDVFVNQLAWAGWTGLLVTGLNLMPVGQLDGGHLLYSLIGERARRLYYPFMGALILLVLTGSDAWLFWLVLLFLFGRVYAAPLDMITPLDRRRKWIAVFGLIVFLLTFVPVPFSVSSEAPVLLPRDSVWFPVTVSLISFYTFIRRR